MIQEEILQSQLNKSRKDKFLLVLQLPPAFKKLNIPVLIQRNNNQLAQDALQFSVYGSVLPQIEVPAVVASYGSQSYKVSSNSRPPFEDITVNFTIDNKFNNYWVIYKWLDVLNDERAGFYDAKDLIDGRIPPKDYQADFTLYALDEFDKRVVKFTYTQAFPTMLGGVDYNYRDPNEMETSFSFAFSQFFAELI